MISLEFDVVLVCSTELSRSAFKFVGEVVSVIVVFRDSFLEQNKLIMIVRVLEGYKGSGGEGISDDVGDAS